MESPRSIELKVGVFVTIALILTVAFILALGGDKTFLAKNYHLHMILDETGGLGTGSVVQVLGVPAGHVEKITFLPSENKVDIELGIDQHFQGRITRGSVAGLRTQGALGDKYVLVKPGPVGGETLKEGETLGAEIDSDLLSALGKSGGKINKAFDIIDDIEKMIRALHEKGFAQNLAETARNMKESSQSLDDVLSSVRGTDPKKNKIKAATDHLASILEKIDSGQGTLGGLINDPTVHEDMKTILGGAQRSKVLKYLIRQTLKKGEEGEKEGAKP